MEYYKVRFGIDLNLKSHKLHFLDVEKLLSTEQAITVTNCEPMMQFFSYIFAILLNHETLKQTFIETIMSLDEELQESLQGVIEKSVGIIDNLQGTASQQSDSVEYAPS